MRQALMHSIRPEGYQVVATGQTEQPPELLELLRTLLRHKWLVLGAAVVVPALTTFYAMGLPKVYEATAVIEYDPKPPRPLGNDVEDVADPVGNYWMSREWYATQNKVIASRAIAEVVVRKLGLHRDPGFVNLPEGKDINQTTVTGAAGILKSKITVTQPEDTRLVQVSVEDGDPERAALLANTIVDVYIDKLGQDRMGSTVNALDWLSGQLDNLKSELEQAEMALYKFKDEHKALSMSLEDQRNLVAQDIQRFSQALTDARMQRIEMATKLEALHHTNRADPLEVHNRWVDENANITPLRADHKAKLAEREQLSTRLGPEHPRMKELKATMAAIEAQIRKEIDGLVESAENDLKEVQAREKKLRQELARAKAAGMALSRNEIEYRKLSREQKNTENLYGILLERTTETDLTRLLQVSHVKPVERALTPVAPISPNLRMYLVAGIMLGLLLGVGVVMLITRIDTKVRSAEEIEALGVTALGVLPPIGPNGDKDGRKQGRKSKRGKKGKASTSKKPPPERDLVVHAQPKSAVAECCRTIRTNITFMTTDQPLCTLMVTSPNPLEGKTTVAISLAVVMAQSGKRVLLVDTDLRRPRIHHSFGLHPTVGITSVIVEQCSFQEVVHHSEVPGLDVLPCGPTPPNPSEILQTAKFAELLQEARSLYDLLVFDSPPLGAVTDAAVLGPQVAGTILVVQGGSTSRHGLYSAIRQLRGVGANLLGAVLNGMDMTSGRYGYGYGYGYRGYYYYRGYGYSYGYYGDSDAEQSGAEEQKPALPV